MNQKTQKMQTSPLLPFTGDGSIVCDSTRECEVTSVVSLVILVALVCMFPFLLAILAVSGQACCCGHVINSESGLPVCGEVTWHLLCCQAGVV